MKYNVGAGKDENFIIAESEFNSKNLGKCESIMYLGNGYMGVRNTMEEDYLYQKRACYVAGMFNKSEENEVAELPNAPDVLGMKLFFDDDELDLNQMTILDYSRTLNLRTGLGEREVTVKNKDGLRIKLLFKRFVSMDNLHLIAQKIYIIAIDADMDFCLSTGINGQMTNSGAQNFFEGDKRIFDGKIMNTVFRTTQSEIDFVISSIVNMQEESTSIKVYMERRKIGTEIRTKLKKGNTLVFEKLSVIHTSRDADAEGFSKEQLLDISLQNIREAEKMGFDSLFDQSQSVFMEKVWNNCDVKINSENPFDQLALRFSIYHLTAMTPAHDERMGIGAKGLSGEGFKGHSFWDTEIFCLPFFIYERPEIAKSLLKYRYHLLPGARQKAEGGNYRGAQYPWESAWIDDGEVTPVWGWVNVFTGEPVKIWTGLIQIHITSDVAYAIEEYYQATNDICFMKEMGFQIIFETAHFWASRLEYNEILDRYEINDVIGPDEYKEHVNNNAFTNYMAHYNMELALRYHGVLKNSFPDVYNRLQKNLDIESITDEIHGKINRLYLPQPREDLLIPQNDTYLTLREIDLRQFKNQKNVGEILQHYSLEEINQIQASKQADILVLLLLMEDKFDQNVIRKNFDYYEARTLHDSSLSLSTHCIMANRMGNKDLAYSLFEKTTQIDLGPNMKTSDGGIHAAAMGSIWQCAVFGFAGIRTNSGMLEVNPRLPEKWNGLDFNFIWKDTQLHFQIDKKTIRVSGGKGTAPFEICINGKNHSFNGETIMVGISE